MPGPVIRRRRVADRQVQGIDVRQLHGQRVPMVLLTRDQVVQIVKLVSQFRATMGEWSTGNTDRKLLFMRAH